MPRRVRTRRRTPIDRRCSTKPRRTAATGTTSWAPNPVFRPGFPPPPQAASSWGSCTTRPGSTWPSTMPLTGQFYLRVKPDSGHQGALLIDPTSGLPVRSADFIDAGYDRQPDFTIGLTNTFRYKRWTLDFLLDIRKGGDVFDATDHYLTTHGLRMRPLDRDPPRVIRGVL